MKRFFAGGFALRTILRLRRFQALEAVAAVLCSLSLLAWTWVLPQLQARVKADQSLLEAQRITLVRLSVVQPAPVASKSQNNLDAFRMILGDRREVDRYLAAIFNVARHHQLALVKGEYKLDFNPTTRTYVYQVLLPVVGTYASVRRFCNQVLVQAPFASLDEISYRRESVAAGIIEARLHFSLHLADRTPEAPLNVVATPVPVAAADLPVPVKVISPQAPQTALRPAS